MGKFKDVPLLLILLGGILLVASVFRSYLGDPSKSWTEADAESHARAGNEYHALAHQWEHARTEAERRGLEQGLEEVRARYEESGAALRRARNRYELPIRLMRWSGTVCLALGAIGYYVLRGVKNV